MPGVIPPSEAKDIAAQLVAPAKSDSPDSTPEGFTDPPNVYVAWAGLVSAVGYSVPHHVTRAKAAIGRLNRAVS